jgi:hypothetical protein
MGVSADCRASEPGFYIGADAALVAPTVGKSDGANFGTPSGLVHVSPDTVRHDDQAFGWGALVGYRANPHFAAELTYVDFGSIDGAETFDLAGLFPDSTGADDFTIDFDLRAAGPMASVMGIVPFAARYEAFARVGMLWASQEVRLAPGFSREDAAGLWAFGLGLQAELGRGWSGRLEYQRFEEMPGTDFSGELRPERLLLGATYDLGFRNVPAPSSTVLAARGRRGFYAVADVGVTEPAVGKSDGFLITFTHLPGLLFHVEPSTAVTDGSDAGGGVAFGYRINRYLAAELAYTDFGSVEIREHFVLGPIDSPFPPFFVPRLEFDVDLASRAAGPSVSVLAILPISDGFDLFARGGILFADHEIRRNPGTETDAERLAVWGVGIDVRIAGRWSARVAYENLEDLPETAYTGPMRLERFVFGASYAF